MILSPHFTLAELTLSQEAARSGLKNVPNALQVENLTLLCNNVLEPLRMRVRRPIIISSGFRSKTINKRIGGSEKSQHCKGEAVDFTIPGMSVVSAVLLIKHMGLPFDQLIDEYSQWVHVSHSPRHRRHVLTARIEGGKTVYKEF